MSEWFDKKAIRRWRRDVWREFRPLGVHPAAMPAALIMAGVSAVGTDQAALSELTGSSPEYVTKVLRRLRQQRILIGQTLRIRWEAEGFEGTMAALLDAMVAAGELARFPDKKRSAAQKARARETFARGPRRHAAKIVGPYMPKAQKSNPLYGLAEWEKQT